MQPSPAPLVRPRHRQTVATLLAALACVAFVPAQADSWPSFQFNAGHPGLNASEHAFTPGNVKSLRIAWKGHIGSDSAVEGGAVVSGGQIFVPGFDGRLSAFDERGCGAEACEPLWQGVAGADFTSTPAATPDAVFIASADHFLHAFAAHGCGAEQCEPLWRGQLSAASIDSSVAIVESLVFVGDIEGQLSVFNAAGCGAAVCQPLWVGQAGPHEQIDSAPAAGDGFVFVQTSKFTPHDSTGRLLAFPLAGCGALTCQPAWTADLGGPAGLTSAPIVVGNKVIVGSERRGGDRPNHREHLFAFDASGCGAPTCPPVQFFEGGPEGVSTTPATSVDGSTLFVGSNESIGSNTVGVVTAYDLGHCGVHCQPLWTGINASQGAISPPAVAGDLVFVGKGPASFQLNDAGVYAFDVHGCGKPHCRPLKFVQASTREMYFGAPLAIADGHVTFVSTDFESLASSVSVMSLP